VLRPEGGGKENGLRAEYFANKNFSGKPSLSRVEERGYFVWDMQDPSVLKAAPRQSFSLRWSASVQVNQSGDYEFGLVRAECHSCGRKNAARLYIEGQLLVDDSQQVRESMYPKTGRVHLEAGKPRNIRVEYNETGRGGGLQLVWKQPADAALNEAPDAVKQANLAIVCIGLNARLEGEEMSVQIPDFSGGDRTNIDLPEPQQKLLEGVLDAGKPTIVVLVNGSALAVNTAKDRAGAILETWYGGQEGGTAIADTLAGDNNRAGRLPVTFYESVDQLPAFDDYSMKGRTYRYFTSEPLFPFGYGLSYSEFRYSDIAVRPGPENITHYENR
jgi:beta-glucosidase